MRRLFSILHHITTLLHHWQSHIPFPTDLRITTAPLLTGLPITTPPILADLTNNAPYRNHQINSSLESPRLSIKFVHMWQRRHYRVYNRPRLLAIAYRTLIVAREGLPRLHSPNHHEGAVSYAPRIGLAGTSSRARSLSE